MGIEGGQLHAALVDDQDHGYLPAREAGGTVDQLTCPVPASGAVSQVEYGQRR
ncbi:hypothetical protein [Virgisporangium ochraceum]|uniref:hypothetical protein n=1 Tax=Virgisporangium ochraceum TaxID=65505 RepID=UPI001944B7DA|nr:hypothetical protein [Virgisporangium ochraceum]